MDKWQNAVVTSAGISMLGQVISGGKLNITRAALGSGTVDASALMAQKALTLPLDVSVVIAKMELIDGSGISIRLQIRNTGVTATRTMKQIGLFAKVGDGEEALFAIMQDDGGEEIPSESSYPDFMLEFTTAVAVSNTDGITVTVSGSAVVTLEELEERLKGYATSEELGDKADKSYVDEEFAKKADSSDFKQHSGDLDIHVTADEKAGWNGKADETDFTDHKNDTTVHVTAAEKSNWVKWIPRDMDIINDPTYESPYESYINDTGAVNLGIVSQNNRSYWHILYLRALPGMGYGLQIAMPLNAAAGMPCYRKSEGAVWDNWRRFADGGNADTLGGKHAEDFKILTFVDNDADVTCIEARRDNTIIRLQIQTNMEIARLFKSTDGGASWTGLPLGDAASVGGAPLTTNASTIGLHQISSGSAAATTANCPVGTWYGKHS